MLDVVAKAAGGKNVDLLNEICTKHKHLSQLTYAKYDPHTDDEWLYFL